MAGHRNFKLELPNAFFFIPYGADQFMAVSDVLLKVVLYRHGLQIAKNLYRADVACIRQYCDVGERQFV